MHDSVLKPGIGQIDLADFAVRIGFQQLVSNCHRIHIGGLLYDIRIVRYNVVAAPLQCILPLLADRINLQIFLPEVPLRDQLDDIGVIAACKTSVGSDHDHCLLTGLSCSQIRMIQASGPRKHGSHRLVHTVEVCLGLLRTLFCPLQLNGRNKFHGFGNLLSTLNTAFTPFNVSH